MNLSVGPLSIMLQYEPVRKAIHFYLWIHLRARNQKIGEPIFILSLEAAYTTTSVANGWAGALMRFR